MLIVVALAVCITADAEVVREVAVRRCAARFEVQLVVETRRANPDIKVREPRIGTGLDDLVDEAGQTLRLCVRGGSTGRSNGCSAERASGLGRAALSPERNRRQ